MAEYPALPLFTDAFIADTVHLDATQIGAYLMLLMMAWRTSDCSIPNDDKWICKICRLHGNQWRKMKPIILAFWQEKNGKLYQKRLTAEAEYVRENSIKNRSAARQRWEQNHNKLLNNKETHHANAMPNGCQIDAPTPTPTPTPTPLPKTDSNLFPEVGSVAALNGAARPTPSKGKFNGQKELQDWNGDNGSEIPINARVKLSTNPKWGLPDDLYEQSKMLGWSEQDLMEEIEKFYAYWQFGKGNGTRRTVRGWQQSWLNWLSIAGNNTRGNYNGQK